MMSFLITNVTQHLSKIPNALKVSIYGVFSGPYFPAFVLNTDRYEVSLCNESECGPEKTPHFDTLQVVTSNYWVNVGIERK